MMERRERSRQKKQCVQRPCGKKEHCLFSELKKASVAGEQREVEAGLGTSFSIS